MTLDDRVNLGLKRIDQQAMIALAREYPQQNLHITDLPYRFCSWAFDNLENIALWYDQGGQLQAWAVMQAPFWTIDYVYNPHSGHQLHPKILAWADRRAGALLNTPYGRPAWFVKVFAEQSKRILDLESAGFTCQADVGEDSWSEVLLRWSADSSLDNPALPDGFHIRPLAGENEVAAYVSLQRAVFGTDNMTEPWRRRIIHQPQYQPELDLVVSAPDGRLAAFCICWIDPNAAEGIIGQIEPLGVHENYRQLGLAKAILCEGLRRLRQLGAAWVYVQTDDFRDAAMQLYQAVGFQIYKKVLVFRKDFPVSPEKINDG